MGGYRSYTGLWEGGASALPPVGGYQSYEAFWLGGAMALAYVPPTPPSFRPGGDDRRYWRDDRYLSVEERIARDRRIKQEDDEILAIFTAIWR